MNDPFIPNQRPQVRHRQDAGRLDPLSNEDAAQVVLGRVPFVDVLGLFMHHLPPGYMARLRAGRCKAEVRRVPWRDRTSGKQRRDPRTGRRLWLGYNLRCYQPGPREIAIMEELQARASATLSYVEMALDLVVRTDNEARALAQWLIRHFVQPGRHARPFGEFMTSTYGTAERRWRTVTWAIYRAAARRRGSRAAAWSTATAGPAWYGE